MHIKPFHEPLFSLLIIQNSLRIEHRTDADGRQSKPGSACRCTAEGFFARPISLPHREEDCREERSCGGIKKQTNLPLFNLPRVRKNAAGRLV